MEELLKLVTEKAGISPQQAQNAITTVIGFLKDKLPQPIAGELDKLVAGGAGGAGGELGNILGAAEGLLGGLGHKG